MKSLSLLAEKYQEVQFNDPAVMVEAHSPHQLLESLKEYNKTHDLKAVFNYIAESRKNGSVLVTESLIEKNAAAAATILAVEKILTYYIEGKDARFNREVLLALEAAPLTAKGLGFKRRTSPAPGTPPATGAAAPAAPAAGASVTPGAPDNSAIPGTPDKHTAPATPGAPQKTGAWAGLKNIVGKGLEYLGKAAGKFAGGVASQKTTGTVEDAPYGSHDTSADLSTLSKNPVPINPTILANTYGVSVDDLDKLKDGTWSGINLTSGDKFAEIKYGKNGLYTIRNLSTAPAVDTAAPAAAAPAAAAAAAAPAATSAEITTSDTKFTPAQKASATKELATLRRKPATQRTKAEDDKMKSLQGIITGSYVPFTSLANKVLKEFYNNSKPLPLETINKK